jgi:dipeptidyl-peptidase-4
MDLVTIADVAHPEKEPDRVPYPRPGRPNARVRFGLVPFTGGATTWIALDDARWPYVATVTWSEHGKLALYVLDRLQKNAELLLVDTKTGATRPVLAEHDDAWLNVDPSVPRFLADGRFLWSSDRAGERRLELRAASGELVWTAAPGYARLADVDESARRAVVDVHVAPTRSAMVDVDLARGKTEAVAPGPPVDRTTRFGSGQHDLFVTREATSTSLARHRAHDRAGKVDVEIPSVAEDPGQIPGAELETVGPDDVRVAILRPRGFVKGRSYPVIDAAYGGPHHNVVQAAPYLRDQWLADATGAIVVAIDARGTERRGRAWERALAGRLGDVPLAGHVEALAELGRAHPEMDMSRVGIYGWSFGGYLAALAIVARPDVFKAGVAGAPVTEWRDYDSAYTERYLGLPEPEKAAYDTASVLVRAAVKPVGTARPLLVIHGTADDNVFFTHTLKLVDVMERAGRPFDLMPLAGITHLPYEPDLAEALWTRVAGFLRGNL